MSTLQLIKQEGIEEGILKGMEKGMEKGIEKGMKKGELKKTIQAVKALHKEKCTVKFIARVLQVKVKFVQDVIDGKIKSEPKKKTSSINSK